MKVRKRRKVIKDKKAQLRERQLGDDDLIPL
jgi:hypothetical protein